MHHIVDLWWKYFNISWAGISSTATIGTPIISSDLLTPTGISSTVSIGTPTISLNKCVTWITPVEITPSTTGSFVDIDVSSYCPSKTSGVILQVSISTITGKTYAFRCNGSTDSRISSAVNITVNKTVFVGVDNNRVFEAYVDNITDFKVYLCGYFDSSAVFNVNGTDISLSTNGSYVDIDINVNDSAIGAILEITNTNASSLIGCGIRKNGSTDTIYEDVIHNTNSVGAIVGLDDNEIFEAKIETTDIDFYLIGYVKSRITFNTNATNISLSSTGEYVDIALPNGSTGGFIEVVNTGTSGYNFDLRKNGSANLNYYDVWYHNWFAVECDENYLIEGKIENTSVDFYLVGYTSILPQNLLLTGISSSATIGTPTISITSTSQNLSLTGIDSTTTIGTSTLIPGNKNLVLTGINSTVNIGFLSFSTSISLQLTGISSTSSIGNISFDFGSVNLSLTGINSTVSIGIPTLIAGMNILSLTGISSTVNIGTPTLNPGNYNLSLTGINSSLNSLTETGEFVDSDLTEEGLFVDSNIIENGLFVNSSNIGKITFVVGNVNLSLTGISSTVNIGNISFSKGNVNLPLIGISSTASLGIPTLVPGNKDLALTGIESSANIGTITYNCGSISFTPIGIESSVSIGTPILNSNYNLPLTGIPSSATIGNITYIVGNVDLSLNGISSSCSIGNITLNSNYNLSLTGITNSSTIGTPTVSTPSNGTTWIDPIEITPNIASAWTDVDLSAYILENTSGVMLHVETTSTRLDWGARKNGSTDDRHIENYYASHTGFSIGVDVNRVIELYVESITDVNIYLVGYFDDSAVFNTNATNISLSSIGAWADIDLGVDDDAIGAIVEVYNTEYNASYQYGLRKNGSSDNRYTYLLGKTTAFIGVDGNEIFEGKISNASVDFYLTGYIKSGVIFKTNATDLSLSSTGSYQDLIALPEGSIGGFIEYSSPELPIYSGALRKNGSSQDIYRSLVRHGWLAVECDENHLIEGKISSTNLDFFLTGYATFSNQSIELSGIDSTVTIGNIHLSHLLSVTGINNTIDIGTISFNVGDINLVLSGIPSTLTIGNINLFSNLVTTIYKLTTEITSRDISIDIVKRNIGLMVTDRDISVDIVKRNIDISAVERELDIGIEVT